MGLPPLPLLKLSDALSLENMVNASGKLGGVAGVFAGVHICRKQETRINNVDKTDVCKMKKTEIGQQEDPGDSR